MNVRENRSTLQSTSVTACAGGPKLFEVADQIIELVIEWLERYGSVVSAGMWHLLTTVLDKCDAYGSALKEQHVKGENDVDLVVLIRV
jgi:hypothetical protein